MERAIRKLLLPTALIVLGLAVPAQADASALAVQQDCVDSDVFEQRHSRADLKQALGEVQADVAEYSECERMIRAALAALGGKGGSGDGPGGADAASVDLNGDGVITPRERRIAAKRAKEERDKRNRQIAAISDDLVQDDAAAASGDSGSGGSSLPLILALVALLLAGAGGGLWYASKRNPAVANALRRVPVPFRNS